MFDQQSNKPTLMVRELSVNWNRFKVKTSNGAKCQFMTEFQTLEPYSN